LAEMNPVNWFEIPAADLARATAFYEALFEVKLEANELGDLKMSMFPMAQAAPGAAGALVQSPNHQPATAGTTVYFFVADLDAALGRVEAGGGKVVVPRTDIGEHGYFAQFEDTEGNRVALHTPAG